MDETEVTSRLKRLERQNRIFGYAIGAFAAIAVLALAISFMALLPWLRIRAAFRETMALNQSSAARPTAAAAFIATPAPFASPEAAPSTEPNNLLSVLRITVMGKCVLPKNIEAEQFSDEVELTLTAENLSARKIRAYEGAIEVRDLLGNQIMGLKFVDQAPLDPHKSQRFTRDWEINQFENSETRFEAESFDDLHFLWEPAKIVFADGTTMEATQ